MLRFNANLYRLAMLCASTEQTRYYLAGVQIEPHAVQGVLLIATDGHRAIFLHDESGSADESAIAKLSPEALKACKPSRGERRDVVIFTGENTAQVCSTIAREEEGNATLTDTPLALSHDCRVDGTYPDWRRVLPQSPVQLGSDAQPAHFNGRFLADFARISAELEKHFRGSTRDTGIMRVLCRDAGSPALIQFSNTPEAFGVLMPIRADMPLTLPAWLDALAPVVAAPVLEAAE